MRLWKSKTSRNNIITLLGVSAVFIFFLILNNSGMLSNTTSGQLVPICAWIIMAVSLNLTVGFLGELSLGHAGFMSVGAYSGLVAAQALSQYVQSDILLVAICVVVGMIAAAAAGIIVGIPALRLRGDYLAIVTLAFGEIIRNIMNCIYINLNNTGLHFTMFEKNSEQSGYYIISGPQGGQTSTEIVSFGVGIVLVILTLIIVMNFTHSKEGRAVKSIRDNVIAAESVGLNITAYKMKGFVVSAALAGVAGVLFALNQGVAVTSDKFNFNTSINVLVMVVLGGMGSLRGSVIAAIVLTILPEKIRFLGNYRMLIYAAILILIMVLKLNERIPAYFKKITTNTNVQKNETKQEVETR